MKRVAVTWVVGLLFFMSQLSAQEFLGHSNSNFSGINGVGLQPAVVVDNRIGLDINLISADVEFGNNFIGINGLSQVFTSDSLLENIVLIQDLARTRFMLNVNVLSPFSTMYSSKNDWGFAVRTNTRFAFNIGDVSDDMLDIGLYGFPEDSTAVVEFDDDDLNISALAWNELDLTFGRKIIQLGPHYFKGGLTTKLIFGLAGLYLQIKDINVTMPSANDSILTLTSGYINYGHSASLDPVSGEFTPDLKLSVGFDLGVVYEFRPKEDEMVYHINGNENEPRHDLSKYKYRVGLSILDFGAVKFNPGPFTNTFSFDNDQFDANNDLQLSDTASIFEWEQELSKVLGGSGPPDVIKMSLPTTLAAQFDYLVWERERARFYVGATGLIGFKPVRPGARRATRLAVIPRLELKKWLELSVPISINNYNRFDFGFNLHALCFGFGFNNLLNTISSNNLRNTNAYVMLKIPVFKKHLLDDDGDLISNRKDKCKSIQGVWEHRGCLDFDKDGVSDYRDKCPNEKGTIENKGCPGIGELQQPGEEEKLED